MDKFTIICGIVMMIVFGFLYFSVSQNVLNSPQIEKQTKCYDAHYNEMINQTCKEKVYIDENLNGYSGELLGLFSLFTFLFFMLGILIFISGFIINKN